MDRRLLQPAAAHPLTIGHRPRCEPAGGPAQLVRHVTGRSHSGCDSIPFLKRLTPDGLVSCLNPSAPALISMDEDQGRPGPVALKSGHLDAPKDAPKPSLCHFSFSSTLGSSGRLNPDSPYLRNRSPLQNSPETYSPHSFRRGPADGLCPSAGLRSIAFEGEHHENVPGK
jgi:hypothetical protein